MASEVFKLKSIDLENSVVRNPRVGILNRPTSRTIESGATGPNASENIYTGERNVNADYLVEGTLKGNIVLGSGNLEYQDDKITNVQGLNGLQPGDSIKHGDVVRMDGDTDFYGITGASNNIIYLQEVNTTFTGPNPGNFQLRKNKLDSVHFQYIKSSEGEDKFVYDRQKNKWTYTGIEPGDVNVAKEEYDNYIEDDPIRFKFLESNTDIAPDLTHLDTTAPDPKDAYGRKVLQSKLSRDTAEIILNPIPYPDDNVNFKVYYGPQGNVTLREKDIDYTINYTSDPDYSSAKLPYEDRTSAYIFFMNQLKNVLQVRRIGVGFEGIFTLHEPFVTDTSDEAPAITNVYPNAKGLTTTGDSRTFNGEIIKVGSSVSRRFFDYNIEYGPGIINFIEHSNLEPVVQSVIKEQNLIWDGVSVIKGVSEDNLKSQNGENLVLPYGIVLTGIDGPVFFEDTEDNNLNRNEDYLFEYTSGAFRLDSPLKPNECVLVSYFTEGVDIEKEELNLTTLRTQKFPVIESSVSIKKVFSNSGEGSTGIKILVEGTDFTMNYLTGRVILLNPTVTENMQQLEITYTPFSQVNVVIQPLPDNEEFYRMTIIDDIIEIVDPFNLIFKIRNPGISVESEDPFGEEATVYESSIINNSLQSVKAAGEPGYGLDNLTRDQMYSIGITGLQKLGLDKKLNKTPKEFLDIGITGVAELGIETDRTIDYITTNYIYSDEVKEIALNKTSNINKPKPDLNDTIVSTYSFESDVLPYAPVQTIYPILEEDDDNFLIEGFDKTDVIRPGMVLRIDNSTPKNSYYFQVKNASYDGFNTLVTLYGTFEEDIVNPSFFVLDDTVNWQNLPTGLVVDQNVSAGSNVLSFSGYTLETLNLMRPNAILRIDGTDLYEILTAEISDNQLSVNIFPSLRKPFPQTLQISPPIYNIDDTDIQPFYPLVTDPPHPAFKIYYRQPTNAIYGYATIYIDPEKIYLTEYVDGLFHVYTYNIADYGTVRTLATAISNTKSVISEKYNYYPFSLNDDNGDEQYFLGTGFWSSTLVIPFEESDPLIVPEEGYLISITQEMFKYILIRCFKDFSNFLIKEKDRTDLFKTGNLLAFLDKAKGNYSFYEVLDAQTVNEEVDYQSNPLIHTQVNITDRFRDNIISPYIYKYDGVKWESIDIEISSINYDNSTVTFSSDSNFFRSSSIIKFADKYVYQIDSVSKIGGIITLKLDPEINRDVRADQNVKISQLPIYLDEVPPQPFFPITYTSPSDMTGTAYLEINDESISITEEIEGLSPRTIEIQFERYNDGLSQLANAIEARTVLFKGEISVNISYWESYFNNQGTKLRLVPTKKQALPYSAEVSKPAFRINYNASGPGIASEILIPSWAQSILLYEWRIEDKNSSLKVESISYKDRSLVDVVSAINSAESKIVAGATPWSVDEEVYDSYYGNISTYYDIINFAETDSVELSEFPYTVNVTDNFESWTLLDILNRNVLVEDEDFSVEGTGVSLERGIQPYERYELNYLGLNNLASQEGQPITATCRYFSTIPKGYQVDVYMDFLNLDQYYLQKCTEKKFLEIVTIPQIKQILQDSGGSVGIGTDSGSDNQPQVWDGGLVDLYYQLQDEKIKREIYLKIFSWYKQRLRNFAAEAQLTLGFKFGNCSFLGVKPNGQFSLENQYVEDDVNYTLTTEDDLEQIDNSFSKFFPVGYNSTAPRQYPRFGNEYQLSNEVFCYNIAYLNDAGTEIERREGRVITQNAMLSDDVDPTTGYSDIDYDILPYTTQSSGITSTINRSYFFDLSQNDYSTISSLSIAINDIKTSATNIDSPNTAIFNSSYESNTGYRDSKDLIPKEGEFPVTIQMYVTPDDNLVTQTTSNEREDVLTIGLFNENIVSDATFILSNNKLRITFTENVNLYVIPYDKEEKTFRANQDNFKFLKRMSEGDEIQLLDKKNFYEIGTIEKVAGDNPGVKPLYYLDNRLEGTEQRQPILYDNNDPSSQVYGIYTDESGKDVKEAVYKEEDDNGIKLPYYRIPQEISTYERLIFDDNKYFKEKEVNTFYVKKINGTYYQVSKKRNKETGIVTYEPLLDNNNEKITIDNMEKKLPKDGQNIVIRRKDGSEFPVPFVAWDDEFSLGSSAQGTKIVGHKTDTDRIKKTFSLSNFLDFLEYQDEYFALQEGTFNELTGEFKPRQNIKINMKYLNLREERKVSDVLESIKYNVTGFRVPIVIPIVPPFTIPPFFIKISNVYEKKNKRGSDPYFYIDFDRYYEADSGKDGYEEGIIFRSRDRNSWIRFGYIGGDEDVTSEYGFEPFSVYTNFYYPNNLYLKLLVEKQMWLTEISILKDLFDTSNKVMRAFQIKEGPENLTLGSGDRTYPFSEFKSYLNSTSTNLKSRLEAYIEHLRFLRDQSDTEHPYLVDNTSGPLYRTMMENEAPSTAIDKSYDQAVQAYSNYTFFENERYKHWDINNLNSVRWNKDYCRWSLSLEDGKIFQEHAKDMSAGGTLINMGFQSFPAISLDIIDYGDTPPFVLQNPRYRILYDILPNSNQNVEEYQSAYLQIEYTIVGEKDSGVGCISGTDPIGGRDTTERCFLLSLYPTLQDLVDAINSTCFTPLSNLQVIRAASIFDYEPYRNYSTKYILKTYRATLNNDSNGPDVVGNDWINLNNEEIDSRIYVGNVSDHRSYDPRVFFLNREYREILRLQNTSNTEALPGHEDIIPTGFNNDSNESVMIWPHYIESRGKELLSEDNLGPIPIPGRWASDFTVDGENEEQDYTTEFNVISIDVNLPDYEIVDYKFLDYARGEGQLPGSESPRNPLYEMSREQIRDRYGYDFVTQDITSPAGENYLVDLTSDSKIVSQTQPNSEVIKRLEITLKVDSLIQENEILLIELEFDLRKNFSVKDLIDSINNSDYDVVRVYDQKGNQKTGGDYDELKDLSFLEATLIGDENLQGKMKTVDLVTRYIPQQLYVDSHLYNPYISTDDISRIGSDASYTTSVPVRKDFQIGWKLSEEDFQAGNVINLRVDPRTYSPTEKYRFIPKSPDLARRDILNQEGIDTLAFDIYSWDDNASYKIENNVLYLRSATIPEGSVQISLLDETPEVGVDRPEKRLKLIELIQKINNNGIAKSKFFANLRFCRRSALDYEYTYLPDTVAWYGQDGWVPITKAERDVVYLDKDIALLLNSEGSNATYRIDPVLTPFPTSLNPYRVYLSESLYLEARTIAFNLSTILSNYTFTSATYTINQTTSEFDINAVYETLVNGTSSFTLGSYTLSTLATAIQATTPFSASLSGSVDGSQPATALIQAPGNSLPGTLYASYTKDDGASTTLTYDLTSSSYNTIDKLVTAINAEIIPVIDNVPAGSPQPINVTNLGISPSASSTDLDNGSGSLPATLTASGSNALSLSANTGSDFTILTPTYSIAGNVLSITYTVRRIYNEVAAISVNMVSPYTGRDYTISGGQLDLNWTNHISNNANLTVDMTVATTIKTVSEAINAWKPNGSDQAFNADVTWIYPFDPSSLLIEVISEPIPNTGSSVRMLGSYEVSFYEVNRPKTIQEVVSEINSVSDKTGFSILTTTDEYEGYKGLRADYIVPVPTAESISANTPIEADFRLVEGLYVLNMSYTSNEVNGTLFGAEQASLTITPETFSCEKPGRVINYPAFSDNNYSYNGLSDKNISGFVNKAMDINGTIEDPGNLSYSKGILKMDVALIQPENITYGILRNRVTPPPAPDISRFIDTVQLSENDPELLNTHVYFGYLGDIRFWQISDYNIYRQYALVKRRLGLPWDATIEDNYVSNSKYSFSGFFYNLHKNDKFLNYLKFTRFGQLSDSIRFERLVQNKYLWLFLKLHKEIGCDQRVKYLEKKIEEDDEKARLLR